MGRRSAALVLVLVAAVALAVLGLRSAPPGVATVPGALAIETRLLAPCCWNGTLDTHESDQARALRREIEDRVAHGEASDAIEADMVSRFGPQVRALPREGALKAILAGGAILVIAAAIFVATRMRRWSRGSARTPKRALAGEGDVYDARIDAELADLD